MSHPLDGLLLHCEQELLDVGTGGIAANGAVGIGDAVAGNHNGNGIVVVGLGNGTVALGVAQATSLLAIGDGLAIGDALQLGPGLDLEIGAAQVQWQREFMAQAIKVLAKLHDALREQGGEHLDGL